MADPRIFPILQQVAVNDPNQEIRHLAVKGLIWQSDLASVPFLIKLLDYERDFICKLIARALGYMARPTHVEAIGAFVRA